MDDSTPQLPRPSQDDILSQWHAFFSDPLLSLPHLKSHGLTGQIPSKGLRSLYWRYYFALLPSPSAPSSSTTTTYSLHLARARAEYSELRDTYLRSPDGGWVNDGEGSDDQKKAGTNEKKGLERKDVQVNNPLSLEQGNPWQEWFEDLELRRTIRQDVLRTFPDVDYFRLAATQDKLTNLLFIYCKLNPDIGYRQGMHELLAPLLWTVDYDSLSPSPSLDSLPHLVLAEPYIEHDTWSLFSALMKSAKTFYDFTPSVALPIDKAAPSNGTGGAHSSTTSLTLSHTAHSAAAGATVLVQPIVGTAIRIHDQLVKILDNELWCKLEATQIEPQLFTIRWLRLLFGREFPLADVLLLWDGLFSEDSSSLRLSEFVCVAMLLRIREALLSSDYSGCLQLLLRFPAPNDGQGFKIPLLIKQAIRLRDNISASTGEEIRSENVQLGAVSGEGFGDDRRDSYEGGFSMGVGAGDPRRARRGGQFARAHGRTQSVGVGAGSAAAALFAEGGGLVGDLAKGVYGRAEALGINKALFGTFNDLRRSVNSPPANGFSTIPSRPPWDDTRTPPPPNASRELVKLRSANIEISKGITLCIDVLEASHVKSAAEEKEDGAAKKVEEGDEETNDAKGPSAGDGFMALTALKHIRDVLAGSEKSFDSNVLSPLLHSIDVFPSPLPTSPSLPSSPEVGVAPSSPPLPMPPSHSPTLAPPRPVASAPLSRSLSNDSTGSTRSSVGTPPLLFGGAGTSAAVPPPVRGEPPPRATLSRTPLSSLSSSLSYEKTLPARPIPPWESHKLGSSSTVRAPSASASLPRLPPSASTGRAYSSHPPPLITQDSDPNLATFPPTSFSTRPAGGSKASSKPSIVDPLGVGQ